MNDRLHRTDTVNPNQDVYCRPQLLQWVEFQLLDEQGEPLANLPYRATNKATCTKRVPEFAGQSDAQGVIRLEGVHPLAVTLLLAADPLAEVLQTRRLRAKRAEPARPLNGDNTPLYAPQRSGFSPIEEQSYASGHAYHYLRIGQVCDSLPTFEPPLADSKQLPPYHFPDKSFSGFTLEHDQLDCRHVLEICPLRAWSLVLHHQPEYSLVNAYNLGLMSNLAYSTNAPGTRGSVVDFFERQCLDLSRTPEMWDGKSQPCLVHDVRFDDRYTMFKELDTREAEPPEGDTQLFYAISASQVLVAWRGTEMGMPDLRTDLTLRPVSTEIQSACQPSVECADLTPQGKVHLGFRESYALARRIYPGDLAEMIPKQADNRRLFICGHSLGGALGLIQAAALKHLNPVLYTYGMPRTFTLKAVNSLSDITHFRHVNDIDTVPSVPPEAELDNHLYNLYGPLGTTLGFTWSLLQLATSPLFKQTDPYCHHGKIATFLFTEQHTWEARGSSYAAYRSKDGLGAPYYNSVTSRLPHAAKLFVVPSLSEAADRQAEQGQKGLTQSLSAESRASFFPPNRNLKKGRVIGFTRHFMANYYAYLFHHLLHSINPERVPMLQLQEDSQKFEKQMNVHYGRIHEQEYKLTCELLKLQKQLSGTLQVTWQSEGGSDALLRFDAMADPDSAFPRTYG
ncbi:lipase family protein [Pseudomonas huanghezhanensis]|uniref:lipase family protein n=1 Tax=Pseudomonas huanghezhanensis TaxID=3002903 RepID=UPI002285EC01|nr:lipase family protein [Pseudomonas sp. BSw22131]